MSSNNYDVILIGSGMGALTVASLLAQLRGKRVLLVERHFKPGGFTHGFKRESFSWDVGVHYIGQMHEGSSFRQLFDLITRRGVTWQPMPDPFEVFHYPELRFELRRGRDRFAADLIARFPAEEHNIRRYVDDVRKAARGYSMELLRRGGSLPVRLISRLIGLFSPPRWELTTGAYLEQHIGDPQLRALLASQWGDYGLPPSSSPFALHALVVNHYLEGAFYPVGGAGTIAASIKPLVESSGGRYLLCHEVTRILIEHGKAVGVETRATQDKEGKVASSGANVYRAPVVISDAGAAATYLKLVPPEVPLAFREELRDFVETHAPMSCVTLYLGFNGDPQTLGFRGENHWIYDGLDHDAAYAERSRWIDRNRPTGVYLSFPSLKDPKANGHTAEIITFSDYEPFARWRDQRWLRRDADYQALKDRISEALIAFVDQRFPGFSAMVSYRELSTPLTNEFFTGHHRGGIYGLPAVAARFAATARSWTCARSPIPGLYLTGADVAGPGIGGAIMGGLTTLSHLPDGISIPRVFAAATRAAKTRLN